MRKVIAVAVLSGAGFLSAAGAVTAVADGALAATPAAATSNVRYHSQAPVVRYHSEVLNARWHSGR